MTKIIFNADDLGLSQGVNLGILDCYKKGVVNSASLMTNTKYFENAVELIKENRLGNIGLHFNLTEFAPILTTHKTIVGANGLFMRSICDENNINLNEVYAELEAQFDKARDAGIDITHFDSHHHVHMSELLKETFLRISKKYNKPLRKVSNDYRNPFKRLKHYLLFRNYHFYTDSFSAAFYDEKATINVLKNIVTTKNGSIEIMCHPGYEDADNGLYNRQRFDEMNVLFKNNSKTNNK